MVFNYYETLFARISSFTASYGYTRNILSTSIEALLNLLVEEYERARLVTFNAKGTMQIRLNDCATLHSLPVLRFFVVATPGSFTGGEYSSDTIYELLAAANSSEFVFQEIGNGFLPSCGNLITETATDSYQAYAIYNYNISYKPSKKVEGLFRSDEHLDQPEARSFIVMTMFWEETPQYVYLSSDCKISYSISGDHQISLAEVS